MPPTDERAPSDGAQSADDTVPTDGTAPPDDAAPTDGIAAADVHITPAVVADERAWVRDRAPVVVPILNDTRDRLGELFETGVDRVDPATYRREVDAVFADGEVAVNVAGYVRLLRGLDVADDYPGFVVDEVLGRELAATIAGGQPLSVLAQATFHVVDVHVGEDATADGDGAAGADDLDAALAAGFQTRLPGWDWREAESPFAVDSTE